MNVYEYLRLYCVKKDILFTGDRSHEYRGSQAPCSDSADQLFQNTLILSRQMANGQLLLGSKFSSSTCHDFSTGIGKGDNP